MSVFLRFATALAVALTLTSCANSAKLARQSSESLAKGDLGKAYDQALRAVEKDPQNQNARDAYRVASARLSEDYRRRVVATATGDTVAAANLALEFQRVRVEIARNGTAIDGAPEYERAESLILTGAARYYHARGVDAMTARRPKVAVDEFTAALRYDERFSDTESRLADARRAATARVALLPFVDRIGVSGLSQDIADTVQRQISRRAGDEFDFTEIVSASDIERTMTVAELRSPRLEDAVEFGRRIGVDWIVVGRFRSVRSNASQRTARIPIFHRTDSRDSTGATISRWDEQGVQVVTRQRDVTVQFELDVVEVSTGAVLAHRERAPQAYARVVWTDFVAQQPYDRYALLPPDLRKADAKRAKAVDELWRKELGSWDLRDFMRTTRDQRNRTRYTSRDRGDFYRDTRTTPAWLGELPAENEMVFVALHEAWRDVLDALKELDARR